MRERPERTFLSLKEFYASEPARLRSVEVDYGVMWGDKWPHYRVSWISATREVYAFEQGPSGHVVILGYAETRAHADAALEGWVENCWAGPAWAEWRLRRYNEADPSSLPEAVRG